MQDPEKRPLFPEALGFQPCPPELLPGRAIQVAAAAPLRYGEIGATVIVSVLVVYHRRLGPPLPPTIPSWFGRRPCSRTAPLSLSGGRTRRLVSLVWTPALSGEQVPGIPPAQCPGPCFQRFSIGPPAQAARAPRPLGPLSWPDLGSPEPPELSSPAAWCRAAARADPAFIGEFWGPAACASSAVQAPACSFALGHAAKGRVFRSVAAGDMHFAALTVDGSVVTWGYNDAGQCGQPPAQGGPAAGVGFAMVQTPVLPTLVEEMEGRAIVKVACGFRHTVCLARSGMVLGFGSGAYGALGHCQADDKSPLMPPKEIVVDQGLQLGPVVDISCGNYLTVLLGASGRVVVLGGTDAAAGPRLLPLGERVPLAVACGGLPAGASLSTNYEPADSMVLLTTTRACTRGSPLVTEAAPEPASASTLPSPSGGRQEAELDISGLVRAYSGNEVVPPPAHKRGWAACIWCGSTPPQGGLRCSRCKGAFYCSPACQKRDWPSHKKRCATKAAV